METRLARALAGTSPDEPRPMVDLELPSAAQHLLDEGAIARLAPAAVLVPVVRCPQSGGVLLTVRGQRLRNHAGQISFPGGRRDPEDAGPVENALREAHEEIGLTASKVEVLGFLDDYPTVTGFRVTPVVALVEDAAGIEPDGGEVVEVFQAPLPLILDPDSYERRWFERGGHRLPFYAVAHDRHLIWGATAGMLRELALRFREAG